MEMTPGFEAKVTFNAAQTGYMVIVKLGDAKVRAQISGLQWNSVGQEAGIPGQLSMLASVVADSCTQAAIAVETGSTPSLEADPT
jgi:hypothetical protein